MKKRLILIIFLAFLVAAGGIVYYGQKEEQAQEIYYSGTIEATQSDLAFEVNGRVKDVLVDEGQSVKRDQTIAVLDQREFLARKNQARARLEQAIKSVKQLETVLALNRSSIPAEVERAREAYHLLKEGFRKEAVQTARARVQESLAALKQSRSNLKKIEVTERELEVAKTRVEEARSALEVAEIHLSQTVLKAPFDGIIVSRNTEPGEVVSPSREVLSLADLSEVELKIFVDETRIGKVRHEQEADVRIDTFPDKTYHGKISFISPEAEFTPKIIQTHKERVKLVYMVKVKIPNPNLE